MLAPVPDVYRKRALAGLDAVGRAWRVVYTSPSLNGLQAAVKAGLGVTVLPLDSPVEVEVVAEVLSRPTVVPV